MRRILNVAEKPSVAFAIAGILGGGRAAQSSGTSRFNPIFTFPYQFEGAQVEMCVTSVTGHLMHSDFEAAYQQWHSVPPSALFFDAKIITFVKEDKQPLEKQLRTLARNHDTLILWLDCDREGEAIGFEVLQVCSQVNSRIQVRRAHFSALIPRDIHNAMRTLTPPDPNQRDAVEARTTIDLRIGAAFTRFQSMRLQKRFAGFDDFATTLSYGPCQFPTLGFVCDREIKRRDFVPEDFWTIEMEIRQEDAVAKFEWNRKHLFDRVACIALYEEMVEEGTALIVECTCHEKRRSRPVPLSTVEMQKALSRAPFRLSSHQSMEIAESLYQRGYLSYPRTETDNFKEGTDLKSLISIQVQNVQWGEFAQRLLDSAFVYPSNGGHDDGAHPPIHPTKAPDGLSKREELMVYEFVTRHFLACCAQDAISQQTVVVAAINQERFTARGRMITARNYLDVYPYDRWAEQAMPWFQRDQRIEPTSLLMRQSRTEPPPLLSESDLISLMDKNGIGTDATIAQHIKTIQDRGYAECKNHQFSATRLGLGLVEGYDALDFHMSQPTLRAHMERELALVSRGLKSKDVVIQETLVEMKRVFDACVQRANVLDEHLEKYYSRDSQQQQRALAMLTPNFTRCACGHMCDIKQTQSQNPQRLLHCSQCARSLLLPPNGLLQPHAHSCPICQYQVIQVTNEQKQTSHTLCPYCFNNPPSNDIEDTSLTQMRCFQCTKPDCALSNKSAATSNDPVRPCDSCGQMMTLKSFQNGSYYIGCSAFPQCQNKFVINTAKEVKLTPQVCETCVCPNGFKPRLLEFKFSANAVPPTVSNPLIACVNGCDDVVSELELLRRFAPNPNAPPRQPARASNSGGGGSASSNTGYRQFSARSNVATIGPTGFVNTDHLPLGPQEQPYQPQSAPPTAPTRRRKATTATTGSSSSRSGSRGGIASGSTKKKSRGGATRARGTGRAVAAFNLQADEMDQEEHSFTDQYRIEQQQVARSGEDVYQQQQHQQSSNASQPAASSSSTPSWRWDANSAGASGASQHRSDSSSHLSGVTCHKCHEVGHYANSCPQLASSSSYNSNSASTARVRVGASGGGGPRGGSVRGGGPTRARGGFNGGGGGGSARDSAQCYRCQDYGHFANECPKAPR